MHLSANESNGANGNKAMFYSILFFYIVNVNIECFSRLLFFTTEHAAFKCCLDMQTSFFV